MNKVVLAMLISAHMFPACADIVIEGAERNYVFSDNEKGSPLVEKFERIAEIEHSRKAKKARLEQIKDDLGLGELERMTVSSESRPDYDELKPFRGASTDQLFSLLSNENFANYWLRIARTIGMVADEESAKKLANFATSPFSEDGPLLGRHIDARHGAVWGLTFATKDQPMPWVRDFLIAHADADQWVEDFGDTEISDRTASKLAANTLRTISRLGNAESLKMLNEVRDRHVASLPAQPLAKSAGTAESDEELGYINLMIQQTQEFAEGRAGQSK